MSHTPQNRHRSASRLIAVVVAVAVVTAAAGIYVMTRGPQSSVERFFELLNQTRPSAKDFTAVITGVGSSGIAEAIRSSPGGTYAVTSVGDPSQGKVSVTWTHHGAEFTSDVPVVKQGNRWKLVKPFPSVTFTSTDRLRFRINAEPGRLNQLQLRYPGSYEINPLPNSDGDADFWVPLEPTFTLAPAEVRQIALTGTLTDTVAAQTKQQVIDAFSECLADINFTTPYECGFMPQRPHDAMTRAQVVWTMTPSNAASQARIVDNHSLQIPCYEITGTLTWAYDAAGKKRSAGQQHITAKGCTAPDQDVSWR